MPNFHSIVPGLLLGLAPFFLAASPAPAQPAFQVVDLNAAAPRVLSGFALEPFAVLSEEVYFLAEDSLLGEELWKSDGTAAGTVLVKDLCPGLCSSRPSWLTVSDGALFFIADDGSHGRELWKTDGTAAGTVLVKDINPGLRDGASRGLLDMGGTLFLAADDGISGLELWKSDGTEAGTQLVADIRPGAAGSDALPRVTGGGLLLLNADDGVHGREPWISDGTPAGTHLVKDINPGLSSSIASPPSTPPATGFPVPEWAASADGLFVFQANDGSRGIEPWATRGTEASTVLLGDLVSGVFGVHSSPRDFVTIGSTVFFTTAHADIWKTDGTPAGTVIVKDFFESTRPADLTQVGDRLFFTFDAQLWVSDGTPAGTVSIAAFQGLDHLAEVDGQLQFFARLGDFGVWRSDGTPAGTVHLTDIDAGPSGIHSAVAAGQWFFRANLAGGLDLWKTDGTQAGSGLVKDFFHLTSSIVPRVTPKPLLGRQGTQLLFLAQNGISVFVTQLFATNGTAAGTTALFSNVTETRELGGLNILTNENSLARTDGTPAGTQVLGSDGLTSIRELTAFQGSVFFAAGRSGSRDLFRTDGATVTPVKDFTSARLENLTTLGSTLFFAAGDGPELWKSDGTETGTVLVKDIDGAPAWLTSVAGTLFFSAATPDEGRELWKSDGTETGTVLVEDIRPGAADGIGAGAGQTAAVGAVFFFVADDGVHGPELWKSDGTEAGTVLVKDIFAGSRGADPRELTRVRNRLFFVADDGVHGRELWVSDGTEAGTLMVADLRAGAEASLPQQLTAMGHLLLFSAFDDTHGREAWRSDGTAAGTVRIQDLAPGPLSSSPVGFLRAGANVYFGAHDGVTGMELWAIPRSVLGSTFGDVPAGFWAWAWIEALVDAGITGGCGSGNFCPDPSVDRAAAAVFLVRASRGVGFTPPPATGTVFADVPADHWAGAWIEQLAADGITGGCSPGLFCPGQALTRAQMAVLLLRARHGITFTPPPASGTVFGDIPASHWAAAWIERLAADGITGGCGGGNFCPDRPVTRAEMAVFLVRAFELPLP